LAFGARRFPFPALAAMSAFPTSLRRSKLRQLPTSPRPGFFLNFGEGFVGHGRRTGRRFLESGYRSPITDYWLGGLPRSTAKKPLWRWAPERPIRARPFCVNAN